MNKINKLAIALTLLTPAFAHSAIVASIGGKGITAEQLKSEYENLTKNQKEMLNKDPNARLSVVENMVNSELLLEAATKEGLENNAELKKSMERFKKQWMVSKYMENTVENKLTNDNVKKFYETNKQLFDSGQVCAEHILVSDESKAKSVTEKAKQKGADFAKLAKENSIEPGVQESKGNLGCFTKDKMVPEFAQAAFTMRKGEVRGPVRTAFGYHVIHVTEIKAGSVPKFTEIEQRAKELYRMRLVQDMLTDLRGKKAVKIEDSEVKKLTF